jgi:hypothetical protein
LYNSAIEQANLSVNDVDSIELIGGVTRVPLVQSALLEASGLEKLNRSMNSDEALAIGATYIGAAASSTFIVVKSHLSLFANSRVTVIHNGTITELFKTTSKLNETAAYVVAAASLAESLTIEADGEPLTTLLLELPKDVDPSESVTLVFAFNELTLPFLSHVTVKNANVTWNQGVLYPDWTLSPEAFANSRTVITRMDQILDERRKLDKARNDYESLIYSTDEKLEYNELFRKVTNETTRDEIRSVLAEHRQFLNDGPLNESVLTNHFNGLKSVLKPIEKRMEEHEKRGPAWQRLNASINRVFNALNNTWPNSRPWLTEEQLNSVWHQYNQTNNWFIERYARQQNHPSDLDPAVSVAEIDTQVLLLEWRFNATANIPKPVPTPKPTPTPSETSENAEGEGLSGGDKKDDIPGSKEVIGEEGGKGTSDEGTKDDKPADESDDPGL